MSVLDDVKRLANNDDWPFAPAPGGQMPEVCAICHGYREHKPDCPWLALPQLVAVVEAAERLVHYADDRGWNGIVVEPMHFEALVAALRSAI